MNSVLGIPLVRIIVILALSWVFKSILPKKFRDKLIPWCFAGLMIHSNVVSFIGGFAHFLLLCLYFIEMAVLLDGFNLNLFRKNNPMSAFLVFWGFLVLSSLWSDYVYYAMTWWLGCLLELVLVGYFAGMWVLRTPNGMRRLLTPLAFVGGLSLVFYFKYGFASAIDASGRGVLDMSMMDEGMGANVNQIGLSLAPFVSSMTVLVFEKMPRGGKYMAIRIASFITLLATAYLLLRTGSRNACLVFLPCAYYVYRVTSFARRKATTMFIVGMIVLVLAIFVKVFILSEGVALRAFHFIEEGAKFDVDYASSGRWQEFERYLANMSGIDWVIGAGTEVGQGLGGMGVGGCLSVYVTLLRFVGVLGLFLLMCYAITLMFSVKSLGLNGQIALLFFMAWAVTGVAEGQGIRRGNAIRMLQGVSLALCSKLNFQQREHEWIVAPNMTGIQYCG